MEEVTEERNTVDQNRCLITKRMKIFIVIGIFSIASPVCSYAAITKKDEICQTKECSEISSRILREINPEINPCDDFYEFVCGRYLADASIPDNSTHIGRSAEITAEIEKRRKTVIEGPNKPEEPRAFKLARTLYRTCMNTSRIEESGSEPMKRILEQLGGWPVLNESPWNKNKFNWVETSYRSWQLGYPNYYLFEIGFEIDPKNSSKYTLSLSPPSFLIPREQLLEGLKSEEVNTYRDRMIDVAVSFGADRQQANQELGESLEFEIKLAEITPSEEERPNTLHNNSMTVPELSSKYPIVNWVKYINKFLEPTLRINADETVIVHGPSFFGQFKSLIEKTPKKVQANYIVWRVVAHSIRMLTELNVTSIPRWKKCLEMFENNYMTLSIDALYVREYFQQELRQSVEELVTEIRSELMKILKKSDWMDEETRGKAIEKATAIFIKVAHPVELLDDKKLDELFAPLTLSSDDFLKSALNVTRFQSKTSINMVRKPVNETAWVTDTSDTSVTEVNAWYRPDENSIKISASILEGPYFGIDRPQYMNYGGLGRAIGHELSHGFDDEGKRYDKDGNLVDWWMPESDQKYRDKAECFVNQYSNYTVPDTGLNIDGNITLSENIADNGGIKLAYRAYKEWVKRHGPEPKLPGLDYEPEQLFWISAASTECVKYAPEYFDETYDSEERHSHAKFRVIGPFSNMPEFAADFNCPLGSKMNPEHKCSIL